MTPATSDATRDTTGRDMAERARRELRGKDLACFCEMDLPCHADVLLAIANSDD